MAKFLTTKGIGGEIEHVIRDAKEFVFLVSPYLQVDQVYRERIDDKGHHGIEVTLIYGKKQLQYGEKSYFTARKWINTLFCEHLHAKCFLNESKALLTSMNLYSYSEKTNREMGIAVSLEEDPDLYKQILEEVHSIKRASIEISGLDEGSETTQQFKEGARGGQRSRQKSLRVEDKPDIDDKSRNIERTGTTTSKQGRKLTEEQLDKILGIHKDPANGKKAKGSARPVSANGSCIKCGDEINADPSKPFCRRHWKYWNKEKYNDHLHEFCHLCGKGHEVTRLKPACYPCYKKNKDIYEWPAA